MTIGSLKEWFLLSDVVAPATPWILVVDGGVSTYLESLLRAPFSHRSLWSSSLLMTESGRALIRQGHRDWLRAGCDIITTVTYQCNFGVVGKEPVMDDAAMTQLLQCGVELAQETCNWHRKSNPNALDARKCFVVASSGCYGAALANGAEYTGKYPVGTNQEILMDFHRRKAQILLDQHPDGLAMETIPCVDEVGAICRCLSELNMDDSACCWVSLACRSPSQLASGELLEDALTIIRTLDPSATSVHAIGVNCCDSAHIASLVEIITKDMALNGPRRGIVVYPNSGEEWDAANSTWKPNTGCTSSKEFATQIMEAIRSIESTWFKYAVNVSKPMPPPRIIVGGCCRTSPATIEELRKRIDGL